MFVTNEFVFINPKLNEINNIKNTQLEYKKKYDYNYCTKVNVKCNVKFFEKIENKTKKLMIERDNNIGEVIKKMQWSKGMKKFISVLELTIKLQGRNYKNVVDAYLKCDNIPILWEKNLKNRT